MFLKVQLCQNKTQKQTVKILLNKYYLLVFQTDVIFFSHQFSSVYVSCWQMTVLYIFPGVEDLNHIHMKQGRTLTISLL